MLKLAPIANDNLYVFIQYHTYKSKRFSKNCYELLLDYYHMVFAYELLSCDW